MSKYKLLDQLVDKNNGYLCTSWAITEGVSKPTISKYVNDRKMERVTKGIYLSNNAWPDDLYQIYLANKSIIFSHETALSLHGLMEREPITSVTVKKGYNATHLRLRNIHVYQIKPDLFELGATEIQTFFGNTVKSYDMERTICDIIRNKNNMDIQIFQYAMKEYMSSRKKNLNQLMYYAKTFNIENKIKTYTEVML